MRSFTRATSRGPMVGAGLAVALMGLFPLLNTDIWWHLAAGRWIVAERSLPNSDPFSWGTAGAPWIDLHWIYQLASYGLWKLGGSLALVIAKVLALFAAAALLLAAARHPEVEEQGRGAAPSGALAWRWAGAGALALSVAAARPLLLARPVIASLLFVALFLLLLERYLRDPRPRWLLLLIPLQLLWANVQPLFVLGPLLAGAYALGALLAARLGGGLLVGGLGGRPLRWLWLTPLGLSVASLVNPYGPRGLLLPLKLFFRIDAGAAELFRYHVSENMPSWALERSLANPLWGFKFVAFAAFASVLLTPRRVPAARVLVLSAFFYLALTANRNILLFCIFAGFVLAGQLAALPRALARRWRIGGALGVALVGGSIAFGAWRAVAEGPLHRPAPFRLPHSAAEVLAQGRETGRGERRLFSSVRYGGYLAWRLYPRFSPFIDGRLVLRSAPQYARFLAMVDDPQRFFAFAARRRVAYALLPTAYPERYLPLVAALYQSSEWSLITTDGTETLFCARWACPDGSTLDLRQAALVERIAAGLRRDLAPYPGATRRGLLHLSRLLIEVGALGRADDLLTTMQGGAATWALRAAVMNVRGRRAEARKLARRAVDADEGAVSALALLARMALADGDAAQAKRWLARWLRQDPFSSEARRLLAELGK